MNKENVAILSGLNSVINFIVFNQVIDQNEFIELVDNGEYHIDQLKDYYANGTIAGNFVPSLFDSVLGDEYDSGESTRIRNSIRIALSQEIIENEND